MSGGKVHLVPQTSEYALCSTLATSFVRTRREFNELPQETRCGRCDAILNGRRGATAIGRIASGRDA